MLFGSFNGFIQPGIQIEVKDTVRKKSVEHACVRSCRGNRIDCRKLNSSCDCITQMPDAEINVLPK